MSLPANFPTSLDSLANPTSTTNRDDPGFELDLVIARIHDILEAIEAKVGITASTAVANRAFVSTGTGTSVWGTVATAMLDANAATQAALSTAAGTVTVAGTGYATMTGDGPSGELRVDMTTTGGPVLAILTAVLSHSAAGNIVNVTLQMDGGGDFMGTGWTCPGANYFAVLTAPYLFSGASLPAAGAHIFRGRIQSAAATAAYNWRTLIVAELKR